MHMDIQQFVAGASEPMWVKPHWHQEHVKIINFHDRDVDNNDNENICSDEAGFAENSGAVNVVERAKELDDAATTLNTLCAANSPLADVQDFLAGWKDSSSAGRILSNALAWFNDSNAFRWACAHGSRDMVRALLENGLVYIQLPRRFRVHVQMPSKLGPLISSNFLLTLDGILTSRSTITRRL